jgi:hypothetical protein
MTAANNRYSYSRATVIRIDVHPVGETWTTSHTHLTLTPRMVADHTYLTRSTHSNLLWGRQQICTDPLPPEKKGSRHNPQLNDCLICGSVLSFSPTTANEVVGKRQASIDNQLLGLPGPYHRHAIGTFNTCSWWPTHWYLTDIDGATILKASAARRRLADDEVQPAGTERAPGMVRRRGAHRGDGERGEDSVVVSSGGRQRL